MSADKIAFPALAAVALIYATVVVSIITTQSASAQLGGGGGVFTPPTSPNQQPGIKYWIYDITLEGISQGVSFQRTGRLVITEGPVTGNPPVAGIASNAFDVMLGSGSPFFSPESGAIWLMTDRAMTGQQPFILAYASYEPESQLITVNIAPDVGLSGVNAFNAYSGVTATAYLIVGGSMQIQSQDNFQTIAGTVDVVGKGQVLLNPPDTWYRATFAGVLVGEDVL